MNELKSALVPAVLQALIVCVLRVFTIPWAIWKGAALRLAEMRNVSKSTSTSTDTEFPVFEWLKVSWDGVIFLSWFVGVVMAVILASTAYSGGFGIFISTLVSTYFGVIGLSLAKEFLILALSIALNVEKISKKPESSSQV
ncbi:hypothetical protein DYI22_10400 [Marinobacter lipolyticus]|uniref:hypothetical protein n=1 Tax=Marinobacter lipolyticus TaxID=209639 RepID=UPI001BCF2DCD|nr:hypothetical protein [Marinobacter lipolyticus]MBS8240911.1 hypothetical protein [Marinobacter lipolyticus]